MKEISLTTGERDVARSSHLFSLLKPDLQARLLASARFFRCSARQIIEPRDVFLILSGHVWLGGHTVCIEVIGVGEVFGESNLFLNHFPLEAHAVEVTTLAAFSSAAVQQDPALMLAFARLTAKVSVDAASRLSDNRLFSTPQRVAQYVLDLWIQRGRPDGAFRLPFQKNTLAGHLGLAPEALSRAIGLLSDSGFVVRDRFVQVVDPDALAMHANR